VWAPASELPICECRCGAPGPGATCLTPRPPPRSVAAAVLLGAALAATDAVLASDVQVGEPSAEEDAEDEVRFRAHLAAGPYAALACPFVYMRPPWPSPARIRPGGSAGDALYKLGLGLVGGVVVGRILAHGAAAAPMTRWADRERPAPGK
jgi:hypothetical protein